MLLTNVEVTGPLLGPSAISCPGGYPIPSLAVDATVTCTATLVLSQDDVDAGGVDNTATATAEVDNEPITPVDDSESVPLAAQPSLTLVKTGTLDSGGDGVANVGDAIDYLFQVTNNAYRTCRSSP